MNVSGGIRVPGQTSIASLGRMGARIGIDVCREVEGSLNGQIWPVHFIERRGVVLEQSQLVGLGDSRSVEDAFAVRGQQMR